VLYHLHNPDTEAFVHTCNSCKKPIDGVRYSCDTCNEFDVCRDCFPQVRHAHALVARAGESQSSASGASVAERQQYELQILRLLVHTSNCPGGAQCTNPYCEKMRRLIDHANTCPTKVSGGCKYCKRFLQYLMSHARQCRLEMGRCRVPHCDTIRQRIRQSQNAEADRRMQAVMRHTASQPAHAGGGGADSPVPANSPAPA